MQRGNSLPRTGMRAARKSPARGCNPWTAPLTFQPTTLPESNLRVPTMNNFTPRAQQVLALARKEADRFNHNYVGTEHLLLGLIKLGQGVAVNVLTKLGLDLETVRMQVEQQVGSG